jgi:5-methylthioribose kinase
LRIQGELCPDLTPKVYAYEPDLALMVMEDLSDHIIMRRGLMERGCYPLFAGHIGSFLARMLFFTSDLAMDLLEKKQRVKAFINPEQCNITEDLIFDAPYKKSRMNIFEPQIRDAVELIWADSELHLEVALLREIFLTKAQALLHGDLHSDNIFIKLDSTKVIDPEFAYYGPMGFDIGTVIANLLLNYSGQEGWSTDAQERTDYRRYLLDTVRDLWTQFELQFRKLWNGHAADRMAKTRGYQDLYVARLLQDTIGFAGAKMVCRVHGFIHVADIDHIEDAAARERAQRIALEIGAALIKRNRSARSIDEVLDIALKAVN